MNIFNWFCFTN